MGNTVRPCLRPIELEALHDALTLLIKKLKELVKVNPDDSKLDWRLVIAKRMYARIERNMMGKKGSAPIKIMHEALWYTTLPTAEPEFIHILDAMALLPEMAYQVYPLRPLYVLLKARKRWVIRGFRDPDDGGVWKVAKQDVLRMKKYMEAFRC